MRLLIPQSFRLFLSRIDKDREETECGGGGVWI